MTWPSDAGLKEIVAPHIPTRDARSDVSNRRSSVEVWLRSFDTAHRLFETGSWSHGTALQPWSDVDYFAVMIGVRPNDPTASLNAVHRVASMCFAKDPIAVTIDRPSVSIQSYDGTPRLEITPAFTSTTFDYWIPDPTGPCASEFIDQGPVLIPLIWAG